MNIQTKDDVKSEWETHDLAGFVTSYLLDTGYTEGVAEETLRLVRNQASFIALIINALAKNGQIEGVEVKGAMRVYYNDIRIMPKKL